MLPRMSHVGRICLAAEVLSRMSHAGRMCLAEVLSRMSHAGRICLAEVFSRISHAVEMNASGRGGKSASDKPVDALARQNVRFT